MRRSSFSHTAHGPQVLAGTFQMKDIQFKDAKGISIQQALNSFGAIIENSPN